MGFVEIRRHSIQGFSGSLSKEGVAMARKAGSQTIPFQLVLTSPIQRAMETAVAMGFAIDSTEDWLGFIPEELQWELDYRSGFSSFFQKVHSDPKFQHHAQTYKKYLSACLSTLKPTENALIVSHGGTVEMLTISCCENTDFQDWNFSVSQMQGVRLEYTNGKFQNALFLE